MFPMFAQMRFKSSAADLQYVGKGKRNVILTYYTVLRVKTALKLNNQPNNLKLLYEKEITNDNILFASVVLELKKTKSSISGKRLRRLL